MNTPTLPKALFSSPSQQQNEQNPCTSSTSVSADALLALSRLTMEHTVDQAHASFQREQHLRRLKALRQELVYLSETAWEYQSVEKYLGQ